MVWIITTSNSITTITPDGTSDANLTTLLNTAISEGQSGITKPDIYTYKVTNRLVIAADPGGTKFLYVSGLSLIITNRFVRASNSRVRFTDINAAGAFVGRALIILSNQPSSGAFGASGGLFTASSGGNAYLEATAFDLCYQKTGGNAGAIVYGNDIGNASVGSYNGCTFEAARDVGNNDDQLFYPDAGTYTNCRFRGWNKIELTSSALNFGIDYGPGTAVKNFVATGYFEQCIIDNLQEQVFPVYLTDCTTATIGHGNNTPYAPIYLRNSLEALGGTNEANGLLVVRLSSNAQVYKRTFSSSGLISSGNIKGETDGVSSSSERLLITATIFTATNIFSPDYRGVWEGVFVKYGRNPQVFSYNIQGTFLSKQTVPFSSTADLGITVTTAGIVAAYTEFTIAHSTSLVTIGAATTTSRLHDYSALEKASFADSGVTTGGNPVPKACLPTLGTAIYDRLNGSFRYNLSLAANVAGVDGLTISSGRNVTITVAGIYSTTLITFTASNSVIIVPSGATNLQGWVGAGNTINVASDTATVTVDSSQLSNFVAGAGVTIVAPSIFLSAPNFENGTRFYAARRQTFLIPSAAISTSNNTIAFGNDLETGAVFAGQITTPATLAYVVLATGATRPTSSPQIESGNLYYVSANTSGVIQISESQGGTAIDFSTTGTNNGSGQTLIIVCATELVNTIVSGGTGLTQALTLPNNAQIEIAAQNIASGEATATTLFHRVLGWNSTTGATIAETFSLANNPDEIYNQLIGSTITSKRGLAVTITSAPSTVAGLTFDLSGNIELDANAIVDASIAAPDAYVWMISQRFTQAGIRYIRNQLTALSIMEIDLTGQLTIDNIADGIRNSPATPLVIIGNVYTAENAEMYAPNTGTVRIEPFFVSDLTSAGDGSFTSTDRTKLDDLEATLISTGVFSTAALANAPTSSGGGLDAAGIRAAIGLANANLDTQIGNVPTNVWAANTRSLTDKTGYALSGTQAFNLTGNITGNLSGSVGSVTSAVVLPNIPANWITSTGINNGAITATKLGTDAIDANALATSAVAEIQAGLSTYGGGDTAGVTTLLNRLTNGRATNLDNLNAAIDSRLATTAYTEPDNSTIATIGTRTARVDALIINPGSGDRFTATALSNTPVTTVDLSGVQFALAAINAGIDALPLLSEIEASTVLFKTSQYSAPNNSDILSAIGAVQSTVNGIPTVSAPSIGEIVTAIELSDLAKESTARAARNAAIANL